MSWLDSGLKVDRIIGHSFGQLTALCVAGSLTLRETVYLIVARAHLLDGTSCSIENGTMLSIQGDADDVAILLKSAEKKQGKTFAADVACFNGPRNFVLAGDEASIYTVECIGVKTNQFRMKRLSNSHAYHSRLLDGILPSLRAAAAKLDFKAPSIPIQACTDDDCQDDWSNIITAGQIARHTREPVRFMQTVRRIERAASGRPILWLEAGSSGPVIPMIKNATLDEGKKYHYVSTSLRDDSMAQHNLATATRKLWESNVKVQFWPFHSSESSSYNWLNLPPYQFAKIRHWLEYRPNTEIWNLSDNDQSARTLNEDVFSGYIRRLPGQGADLAYFEINTCHDLYQLALQGHEVVGQSLCPASMYVEFCLAASHILTGAGPDYTAKVSKLSMESPLALYPRGQVLLKLDKASSAELVWDMTIYSSTAGTENQIHATGLVTLTAPVSAMDSSTLAQIFSPMQSLLHARCQEIRTSPASVGYKGSTVYQAFLPHVTYVPYYHGIQSIFSLGKEATAYITLPQARQSGMGDGVCDPVLIDSFTQVSGVLANVFDLAGQNGVEEMWICNYIGDIELNEKFTRHARSENHVWLAYGKYDKPTPKTLTCDIFVLDPQSAIAFIVRSISFQKVSVRSLTKILGKLNIRETALRDGTGNAISSDQGTYGVAKTEAVTKHGIRPSHETLTAQKPERLLPKHNAFNALGAKSINTTTSMSSPSIAPMSKVVEMLQDILEVPAEAIKPSSKLEDLGFDSLIATELLHETRQRFTITISHQELARATQVDDLAQLIGSCGLSTGPDEAIQGRVAARKGRALYGTASPSIIASTTSSVIASGTASSMTSITEPPSPILAQGNTEGSLVNTCSMLRDVLEIPMESIRPNCTLEDLGIDSLLAIELFSEVTKRFSVSLSQAQFADVQTVQELGDLIAAMSKEQATSPPMTAAKQSSLDADKGCTVVYADRNGLKLEADIYYPPARAAASYEPLPIGASRPTPSLPTSIVG
jgi:acyl carrier protein/malonyl CoA-acyl carrier protein transacylase